MGDSSIQARGDPESQYSDFEDKVRRTVYIDIMSPQVTESVLSSALDQFGTVRSVQFIPNFIVPGNVPRCALVEMDNTKQARGVISIMEEFPFMISGMPRPVRARRAEIEMFHDRPVKPGRRIEYRWIEPDHPEFQIVRKMKTLASKHSAEAAFLLERQLEEEAQLSARQQESLKGSYKKYETMGSVIADGTARRLANKYNMNNIGDHH